MTEPIRILVVDDHALVREGIRQALAAPGFAVVGEAADAAEGLVLARRLRPAVALLDISLPGENGIQLAGRLRAELPAIRILMLSVHDHAEYVLESVRSGAHGYLRKDVLPAELREAVSAIHAGRTVFAPLEHGTSGASRLTGPDRLAERLERLTRRERDVLIAVASGLSNKQIATQLELGVRTVESYRESLMRKLGIHTVAGLTRFALEAGLAVGRDEKPPSP